MNRKTCATCGGYSSGMCLMHELDGHSDWELERPERVKPDHWCHDWRRERKTGFNGRRYGGAR